MKRKIGFFASSFVLMLGTANAQQSSFKPVKEVSLKFIKTTGKLSDLPNLPETDNAILEKGPENESLHKQAMYYESQNKPDAAVQKSYDAFANGTLASSIQVLSNWAGINPGADPSDNTMAVGPNHVVQMVNGSGTPIRIFNKSTGAVLKNTSVKALTGIGNIGDPNIVYDQQADRYVLLVIKSITGGDLQICVSKTNDPTGQYFVYDLLTGGSGANDFPDYPKMSVWGNSYFITTNAASPYTYALDRANMLTGTTARPAQKFIINNFSGGGVQAATPVSVIGVTNAPTTSNPIIIRAFDDAYTFPTTDLDSLELYTMSIDWTNTANSKMTGPLRLATAAYDSKICTDFNSSSCINQKGSTKKLDAIGGIVYDKAQYRKFATYESIVCCVFADAGNNQGAIRWYELRKSGTANWSLFQQGTYSPADAQNRFMGSISQNASGTIALGYNIAGTTQFPGQRMTARVLADAAGTMTSAETIGQAGTVAKTSSNRYGDYNAMIADPTDGSFWFSANYNPTSSPKTNIVHFKVNSPAPAGSILSENSSINQNTSLKISPNPAYTYTMLTYKAEKAMQVPLQLMNMEGKICIEKMFPCAIGENKLRLETNNLAAGYYIIKLHTENGVVMEKLVVQK